MPISAATLETGQGPNIPLTDLIKSEGPDTNPSLTPAKPKNCLLYTSDAADE